MTVITCIEDLRRLAYKRVPKMFYDYADTGSWTQSTYRANTSDFDSIKFRQRVAVNLENRNLRSTMLGQEVTMPVALSPVGVTGMQHPDGEILCARAAEKFGVPYTLSTMSICSIETVARAVSKPFWFQIYVMRDRKFNLDLIRRAKDAGCSALVVTLDLQMLGQRHKDLKNGLTTPPRLTIPNILNLATKPRWCLNMLKTSQRTFGNIVGHAEGIADMRSLSAWTSAQFDLTLNWNDLEWIKKVWDGSLILKGIMVPEDARHAVEAGADSLVVSNHGGRQLDGAPSSIHALPAVVDAVGKQIEVWLDGGIATGQNALKAIALGAKAVMIGRTYIYGLGALGENGVTKALSILYDEMDRSMGFCGKRNLTEVDEQIIIPSTRPPII